MDKKDNVYFDEPPKNPNSVAVLAIDDIELNLKLLISLLRRMNISAVGVNSGAAALAWLSENKPQIIMSDLWMPKMDGAELAKIIKSNSELIKIPIIAVTADAEADKQFDLSAFEEIIIKPVTKEKISLLLEKIALKGE